MSTSALLTPMRSMLEASTRARFGWISLQTRRPLPCIAAAICVDFPPGAAQRSSTSSPGCASSRAAGAMALGSCK